MRFLRLPAALPGVGLLGGCVPPPVPAPMAETIPNPPVTDVPLICQPGHWNWTGANYA